MIKKSDVKDVYFLSPMQEGMLFHYLMDKKSPAYFEQASYRIEGQLDYPIFERSFQRIVERYDVLRTIFVHKKVQRPRQVVLNRRETALHYEDLSHLNRDEREQRVKEFKIKDKTRGFDLEKDLLIRLAVLKITDKEYEITWSFHHIIMDGWCISILVKDTLLTYYSLKQGKTVNLPPVSQYKNYIKWLEKQDKETGINYWEHYLEHYENQAFIPRSREEKTKKYELKSHRFRIDRALLKKFTGISKKKNVTMSTIVQTLWGILLQKYNNTHDVVFGAIVSGRPANLENVETMVGLFINAVPVRVKAEPGETFSNLVKKVQSQLVQARSYDFVPLAEIQSHSLLKRELIDHLFIFENYPVGEEIKPSNRENVSFFSVESVEVVEQTTYDLNVIVSFIEELLIDIKYNAEVYANPVIEKLETHLGRIAEQVTAGEIPLEEVEIVTQEEKNQILFEFNNKKKPYPQAKAYELFENHEAIAPGRIAVIHGNSQLSYSRLNRDVNRWARLSRHYGIGENHIVGILLDRSPRLFAIIMALWKVGAAYIPMETDYPLRRVNEILKSSGTRFLITRSEFVNRDIEKNFQGKIIKTDKEENAIAQESGANLDLKTGINNLAYILYTSGSTGKPKGAMVEHIGSMNHMRGKIEDTEMDAHSIMVQNGPQTFDISIWQFFAPLTLGSKTVLYDHAILLEPDRFINRLIRDQATILEVVPSYLTVLLDFLEKRALASLPLKYLLPTGEELKPPVVKKWFKLFPSIKMINTYGPTEASDDVAHYIMEKPPEMDSIPIGKPLPNLNMYIVDRHMKLCPIGIKGEICVSGIGVGRGYLRDEARTKLVFMEDPFQEEKGVRLYKMGDLGCWLPDGNILFLGRKDYQVKVRGHLIEVGEIENRLLEIPHIKEAVVIAREDLKGNKYLVAYLVSDSQVNIPNIPGIKTRLSAHLPGYMIPAYFIEIDRIPLTANGKIDRKALPLPQTSRSGHKKYDGPRDQVEKVLAEIWEELLAVPGPGINDNFFDSGGHSLNGMTFISTIHKRLNVEIPISELFNRPTIKEIAEYIKNSGENVHSLITTVEKREYYPLSSAQVRLTVLDNLDKKSTAYNIPFVMELTGSLDIARLESALKGLIKRHESLRTAIRVIDGNPVQFIYDNVAFQVEHYNENRIVKGEGRIKSIIHDSFIRPFALSRAPLMRAGLIKIAAMKYLVMIDIHHIVCDGFAFDIITGDISRLYPGESLPGLRIQYKDYTLWQLESMKSGKSTHKKKYWLQKLAGEIPVLNLFTDYPRPPVRGSEGEDFTFSIDKELSEKIKTLAGENGATLYMVLLAAYNLLLHKYTGQEDIIVGSPTAGRPHADLQGILGMFVNTLTLRNYPTGEKTFTQFLQEVKDDALKSYQNQDYQFEELVASLDIKRDLSRNPLFDTLFALQNMEVRGIHLPGLQINGYDYGERTAKFDIILYAFETGDGILFRINYCTKLYSRKTIQQLSRHFINVLEGAVRSPQLKLQEIRVLSKSEEKRLLHEFNNTHTAYPREMTIPGLFQQQVEKTPDNIAVAGKGPVGDHTGNLRLTYRELNQKANRLAHLLRRTGVTAESVVGVMMERTPDTVAALLAVLKSGGAYLPIDTGLPQDRVMYMLENSRANALLSTSTVTAGISFSALRGFESREIIEIAVTPTRPHIKDFDALPIPDRSYLDLRNYKNKIGMASVTNGISLQTTRGCPYECLYCHKVWSKNHVRRSPENIYSEIEFFYKKGVRNFAIIDDSFNLDMKKSSQVFAKLIKNKLDIQLFFPNGVRGDILTPGYIDLMVEAGTRGINLSLETASPRLQKLLKKHLDLEKFKRVMDYIAEKHPHIILELATMHGFPTETEEEALMTLDFIKSIRWLHFPYIHILKIYPNTEMEAFALEHGVSKEDILASRDRAFHELPETLPFPKSFTRKYQADFLNGYFLSQERLRHVLPYQVKVVTPGALAQKYNAYLPVEIKEVKDIIRFAQLEGINIAEDYNENKDNCPRIFHQPPAAGNANPGSLYLMPPAALRGPGGGSPWTPYKFRNPPRKNENVFKILFLDLSQHFSTHRMLYNVVEQPLGLLYLVSYLKEQLGDKIDGKVYKSANDFDSFAQLKAIIKEYNPHLLALRTLTFFKEFFHTAISLIRQWGVEVPIITGGPYASSDYDTIVKDNHLDLAVRGEGEYTMLELVREMLKNNFKLPGPEILKNIRGIAYAANPPGKTGTREIILVNQAGDTLAGEEDGNPQPAASAHNLAYVMYTSGSTGRPKGVMVEHRQVENCIHWMQDEFKLDSTGLVAQRTNLSFDPSVWEIFWPLAKGAAVEVIGDPDSRDAEFLIRLLSGNRHLTVMYCPATLVTAMAYMMETKTAKPVLRLPWLIIGAEPISMEVVKRFYSHFKGKIVNTYGPTEGTINNTYYHLDARDRRAVVPIGKPTANNFIYILSGSLQPVPLRVTGEICIAGAGVARGYISDKQRTGERFINNPFGDGKLYKTGDLGRWLEDGNIEIMGRTDNQVKIRGYRIEPGEIENALLKHPDVSECLVVAKSSEELKEKTRECKKCGIWSNYPGVTINEDGVCNLCENFGRYKKLIHQYFKTPQDLELKIRSGNKEKAGKYDCLLVYACERVATYALYKLVEMGFKVLTVSYDSGHYDQESLDRIRAITVKIGVDHIFLRHQRSDDIMKESLKAAKTMCKGCIHTSSSLAGEYAYKNDIKFVIGETLSRGQIVENKLYKFVDLGIDNVEELEKEILKLQRNTALIDKKIFDLINIDVMNDGSIYDKVEFIDFYRYFDVTNKEMIRFLDSKDPYWRNLETKAIYSTDCKICQVGNFNHLKEKGYHYTGSAKSWDQRMGLSSLEDVKEDLHIDLTAAEHREFLENLRYQEQKPVKANHKYLCAYFVSGNGLNASQLKEYLAAELPGYMIPSYFIPLKEFPLNLNGKLDRKALPVPGKWEPGEDYTAHRDDVERKLTEIWGKVLGIEEGAIGIDANFFDLGGHSLNATIVISNINKEFNVNVSLLEIFNTPDIRRLSACIKKAPGYSFTPIVPVEKKEYYTLTPPQARYYILQQEKKDTTNYNIPVILELEGKFEKEKLEKVMRELMRRHENFRVSFLMKENKIFQVVHDEVNFALEYYETVYEEAGDVVKSFVRPFDMSKAPLFRVGLVKVGEGRYILMIDMHHIIADAVSMQVFVREFIILYNGGKLPEIHIQYKDFSEWRGLLAESGKMKSQEEYWLKRFEGRLPVLNLPSDYPGGDPLRLEGDSYYLELDSQLIAAIKKFILENRTTMNILLLSAYNVLLSKYTGADDIIVGSVIHGRTHADVENIIGLFSNTVAIRNFIEPDKTFREFLEEVKKNVLSALDNQDYPLDELVCKLGLERQSGSNPLFSTQFTLQNIQVEKPDIPALEMKKFNIEDKIIKYVIYLDVIENKSGVGLMLKYSSEIFKRSSIEKIMNRYIEILWEVLKNSEVRLKNIKGPGKNSQQPLG
jgi:amino acid adenylation domain-containing protein